MQRQNIDSDVNRELELELERGLVIDQAQAQYFSAERGQDERGRIQHKSRGKNNESDSQEQCLEYELNSSRLPIVRYVPAPEPAGFLNQTPTSEWLAKWVPSDLPSVCIARHNASCYICLMDFEEPLLQSSVRTQAEPVDLEIMEPLRQLPCRHVFHQLCIDTSLQSDESNRYSLRCPVCHMKVISLISYLDQWQADFRLLMSMEEGGPESEDLDPEERQGLQPEQNDGRDLSEETLKDFRFRDGSLEFDSNGLPVLSEYTFEPNNKHLPPSSSVRPLLSDAKKLLENNGTFPEVALLTEAVIQAEGLGKGGYEAWELLGDMRQVDIRHEEGIQAEDVGKDGYEAWIFLGDVRRLDMRHEEGMQALAAGVKRALAADSSAGLLSLAISYLNGYHHKACTIVLLRWLQMHFPTFALPEDVLQFLADPSRGTPDNVVNVFLRIVRTTHIEDQDMLTTLGILFHLKKDYFYEKICYAGILASNKNHLSWNLLGVALHYSDMLEEALEAYNVALQLRPSYTRARVNLGVISNSMRSYKEAAQHYLSALVLQESGGKKATEQLWGYLRDVLSSMASIFMNVGANASSKM